MYKYIYVYMFYMFYMFICLYVYIYIPIASIIHSIHLCIYMAMDQYLYTIHTIFSGMNIHLPAILIFTRGTRFWHTAIYIYTYMYMHYVIFWRTMAGSPPVVRNVSCEAQLLQALEALEPKTNLSIRSLSQGG